ncbi:hypothetical protein BDU57DRAFT_524058 [Ampelomyces quisqualis]|uniref:Mid2 domain-containing protein n=1 Tax=Ampelomyces quisqualis TaxID=50730 RepID=A0A6A5Q7R0_AMPQU|nr:hypothetical protein BDU57DRAFT_524058 [Ampelomyces quisqualis]
MPPWIIVCHKQTGKVVHVFSVPSSLRVLSVAHNFRFLCPETHKMPVRNRRQDGTCPSGGTFYKCAREVGGFSGCCLNDPCFPGGFCSEDKDRLPGRFSSTLTTLTSAATTTAKESGVMPPVSTLSLPTVVPSTAVAAGNSESPHSIPLPTTTERPKEIAANIPVHASPEALPIAAITGAAVGGLVLIILGVLLLLCLRRRKHKNIYEAPVYVSPFNTSSDMAQQSRTLAGNECHRIQQLDSGNNGLFAGRGTASLRHFAELPAEPILRRM